jgi:predicted Zn-dependent protease
MWNEDSALQMLSGALALCEGDAAQVTLQAARESHLRVANNAAFQGIQNDTARLIFRVLVGGRAGLAFTTDTTPQGLRAAAARASSLARAQRDMAGAAQADVPTLSAAGPVAPLQAVDPETLEFSADQEVNRWQPAFALAERHGVSLAGHALSGLRTEALVNSRGLTRFHAGTHANSLVIASDPLGSSGYAAGLSPRTRDVHPLALAERAVKKAVDGRDPVDLEPGPFDVVLEPKAVAELLEWMAVMSFTSTGADRGSSFITARRGERVTGPHITLYDDPLCTHGVGIPMPFDSEGVATQQVTFIDKGVARDIVYDSVSAARAGRPSTGHAMLDDLSPDSAVAARHITMKPGTESPDALAQKVERGLWITRFHYVNGTMDPLRARMTGLTRDGCFEIRDGKLGRGVKTLRFTDDMLDAFARVDGVGDALEAVATWWSADGSLAVPHLLIRGLVFTGRSTGSG